MSKQTAVIFLIEEMIERIPPFYAKYVMDMDSIYVQALQMEQEQIIETWKRGNLPTSLGRVLTAEEYYKETYGGKK
jgi:hypothetical protein